MPRVGTPRSQRCQLGGECGRVGVERFARKPTVCFFDRLWGVQLVGREGNELAGNRGLGGSDGSVIESVVESDCGRRFGWGRGCVGGRGGQQAGCDPQTQAGRRQRLRAARRESELPEGSLSELGPVGHDESVRRIRPCLGPSRSKSQRSSFHCDTFAGLNLGHRTVALVRGPLLRLAPGAQTSPGPAIWASRTGEIGSRGGGGLERTERTGPNSAIGTACQPADFARNRVCRGAILRA